MKPFLRSSCLVILLITVIALSVIGIQQSHQAHAASNAPLYLQQTGVIGSDYAAHISYHRGSQIELWADYYDLTSQAMVYTAHPAIYHSRYCLLNVAVGYTSWPSTGTQQVFWWVTIPKNAPLGTYKYWFTLVVPNYTNQTLMITFTVVK